MSRKPKAVAGIPMAPVRQGRPSGGVHRESAVRSVRLESDLWRLIEAIAEARGIAVNAALREAALAWAQRHRPSGG